MKNWKTTLTGVVSVIVGGLVYNNKIDQTTGTTIIGAIVGILGFFAKDGTNKQE